MARAALLLLAVVLACAASALASPAPFRGSVGPSQPGGGRGNPGADRHGQVSGGIRHDKGYGNTAHVSGGGDAWRSRDGNSRVHVDGHYSKGISGHAKGQRDYGANVNFEHKF
ncbi:Attacin-C [Frankliniella fusca]|uniref:Attacin-C n=1 Tax=Frankliniella fusca TaxID=407009 RepID=A0AAE1LDC6_9NEOP|nr:Attacin-C [Frankliniella fusca]